TTQQYLRDVDIDSCLNDLHHALEQLLDGTNHVNEVFAQFATPANRGEGIWRESNFAKYIGAKLPDNEIIAAHVSLLWPIFLHCAYFPFSGILEKPEIGLEAFRRAFALLVLRGFDLLGAKQDGSPWSPQSNIEIKYSDKVPRLTRIVFECLNIHSPGASSHSHSTHEDMLLQDVRDTMVFTQPITYDPYPYGPSIDGGQFEVAANRLLRRPNGEQPTKSASSRVIPKTKLSNLFQLLLLLRPQPSRWRDGLFRHETQQRSADVDNVLLTSSSDEGPQTSEFVSAVTRSFFPKNVECIEWDSFKTWYSNYPAFDYLFFQLWASIFAPNANPSKYSNESLLPTATANMLCLLVAAKFETDLEVSPRHRFHDNERQLQLDLQASTLVADLTAETKMDEIEMNKMLTARNRFHILLIRGEDPAEGERFSEAKERLIAVFLSLPGHVMWPEEDDSSRQVAYEWRSSVTQLLPEVAISSSSGDGGMGGARIVSENLEFRHHGISAEMSPGIKISIQQRLVDVVGFVDGSATTTMRLTDLKCYRLPGISSKVSRGP
ncbi:MAG: hypothetical protein Q9191_008054, partial [Dirinaria sp. TL-2023a]